MDISASLIDLGRFVFAFLFLLFLPGYAWGSALFPKRRDLLDRFLVIVPLSLSFSIVPIFGLNYVLGVKVGFWTFLLNSIVWSALGALLFIFTRKGGKEKTKEEARKLSPWEILGASFAIMLTFYMVYSVHLDYPFPLHTDEWIGVEKSVALMDTGMLSHDMNLEVGLSVFAAGFFLLSGLDPVLTYQFLPALFAAFSALTLFIAVYKTSDSYWAALFSVLFFAGLKTNITVLGLWFFVAMTLCFPLIYAVFYMVSSGLEARSVRRIAAASFMLLCIALIHPCSASFIFPAVILYLLLRPSLILKNIPGLLCFFSVPFLSFIYFIKFFWKGSFGLTIKFFLDYIYFPVNEFLPWEYYMFVPAFYGELAIVLAVVGIFCIYAYNRDKAKIFVAWALYTLASLYMFYNYKFIVISPYERMVHYALISLAPLSGIGLYYILSFVYGLLKKRLDVRIALVICLVCSLWIYSGYYSNYYEHKSGLYRVIDAGDYTALAKLADKDITHKKVLAQPHTSFAVYPISRNNVVATSPRTSAPGKTVLDVEKFYAVSNCTEKTGILKRYAVDYVYSPKGINCTSLKEIYSSGGRYLYRADL